MKVKIRLLFFAYKLGSDRQGMIDTYARKAYLIDRIADVEANKLSQWLDLWDQQQVKNKKQSFGDTEEYEIQYF